VNVEGRIDHRNVNSQQAHELKKTSTERKKVGVKRFCEVDEKVRRVFTTAYEIETGCNYALGTSALRKMMV